MSHHLSKYYKMDKKIFVVSDVWFNRPIGDFSSMTNDEYNNAIVEQWNKSVGHDDIVYVLGGFGIGYCYDIVLKLNGEIHFLNSVFSPSDDMFRCELKSCVENSVDVNLKKRIFFERNQILSIPEIDCILSYFPLCDWAGKNTNTFCFHGYTDKHNLSENNISCKIELWNNSPVSIEEIKNNLHKIERLLNK